MVRSARPRSSWAVQYVHGKRALSQRVRAEMQRLTRKDPGAFEFFVQWEGFPNPIDFSWVNANDMHGGAQGALDMMDEHSNKDERKPHAAKRKPPSPKLQRPAPRPAERGVQRRSARSRRSNSLNPIADASASESTVEKPSDALLPPVPAAAAAAASSSISDEAAAVAALQLQCAQLDQESARLRQEEAELLVQERDRLKAALLARPKPGCSAPDPHAQPARTLSSRTPTLVYQQLPSQQLPELQPSVSLVRTRSQRSSSGHGASAQPQPQRTPSQALRG
jgi:hypothetical protein